MRKLRLLFTANGPRCFCLSYHLTSSHGPAGVMPIEEQGEKGLIEYAEKAYRNGLQSGTVFLHFEACQGNDRFCIVPAI
ncbi:hypothetical protein SRHO_G00056600 [Serrasalmus rhombeus]